MGAWGHEALQSDAGLDVVDYLSEFYEGQYEMDMAEIIVALRKQGFLGKSIDEIDFYYDNSAMALCELYLMFLDKGRIRYEDEENQAKSLKEKTAFTADKESLKLLLQYLIDIRDEKEDEDGERESVELWRESSSFEDWQKHVLQLTDRLTALAN